jgi:ribonuclease J
VTNAPSGSAHPGSAVTTGPDAPKSPLGPPPPLAEGALRLIPLGGLGAIGRNMTVFEYDGRLLVVDCGVLFPEADQPGVDLILPDFSTIADRLDDIEAVVLTHGHEDHIGGIPYLLRLKADIPLVGSRFTLALVEAKLREHRINPYTLTVAEGQTEQLGPFSTEFFAVNHSIPDALAVAIRTPAGLVLHTGDFKMDQLPLDGRLTDLGGFARLGAEGVDLLLSDSTNAEIPGFVTPEREIGPVLDNVFRNATRRIIVASFASHVHRVQQVLDAAANHGRKVTFVGRSMVRNMGVARDLGLLHVPPGLMVSVDEAAGLAPSKVVFMSTGSQGEPMSALGRMASGDHRHVTITPGDTVVLASSLVPGNETAVYRVINGLARLGADVVHKEVAKVHVSGHAPAGELLYLLNTTRPSNVMPVHGEWRHLRAHGRLAVQSGVAPEHVVLAEDGDVVDLVDGTARVVGHVDNRYVYVDGLHVGDVGESSLVERRILGEEGFVAVTVVVDSVNGKVVGGPFVNGRGFTDAADAFDGALPLIENALDRAADDGVSDPHQLQQLIRRTVGKWVSDTYRRRPMIVPTVLEV